MNENAIIVAGFFAVGGPLIGILIAAIYRCVYSLSIPADRARRAKTRMRNSIVYGLTVGCVGSIVILLLLVDL